VKIVITTDSRTGQNGANGFCRGSFGVTRDLVEFCFLGWPHFKKRVLEMSISNEYTQKIELNSIDFKNTKFTEIGQHE
jgi:hypothetical protein